jgi:tetratricopeptide (TPR) repeat protein
MKTSVNMDEFVKRIGSAGSLSDAFNFSDTDLNAIAGLAASYYSEGKLEGSLKLWQGLIHLRPERAEYWSALGATLTRLERYEEGVPVLSVALSFDAQDSAALVNRGECFLGLANNESAASDLEKAIALDPKGSDPAANRARQIAFGMKEFFEQCMESGLDTAEVEEKNL